MRGRCSGRKLTGMPRSPSDATNWQVRSTQEIPLTPHNLAGHLQVKLKPGKRELGDPACPTGLPQTEAQFVELSPSHVARSRSQP